MKRIILCMLLIALIICCVGCNNSDNLQCQSCGESFSNTSKFCPNCGTSLETLPNNNDENRTNNENDIGNDADNVVSTPAENTNFQLIYDAIKENDNRLVIGSLMNEDIYLSTSGDKIIVNVSAEQSSRYGINPHEHNDTSVVFQVSINKDGSGEGSCILIYKEIRVVDHTTKTTTYKKSTAVFDTKITNIGDKVDYREYKIYYDNEKTYTEDSSGKSYYNSYLSMCKEHYAEGVLQLALESFYSIINE